ncbi:hypothetical protein D9M73_207040 [compost metagenome]
MIVQCVGGGKVTVHGFTGLDVAGLQAFGRAVVAAVPGVVQATAELQALAGQPGEGVMRAEGPDIAAGVDLRVLVVVAGGQGEDEVQALPEGAAEQGDRVPLQQQRADHQVALSGAGALRAAVDIQVQVHQW